MDKKELAKKCVLSYTEPSLFWIPWKKSDKPYGEYVTVMINVPIYTGEDWQRDPVFAVYYADDVDYKNPIYCTALYDKNCNIVRNGIISQSYFNICSEHGSANNPVILPSGKYKIKMLCSGGGAVINDIDEWEFFINRNTTQGKIYSGSLYDYSYRTITINPFKGFKYIQIDCETELVKTCKPSDTVEDTVIQTFDVSGSSRVCFEATGYYKYDIPMIAMDYSNFLDNVNTQLYLLKAVFNEKISTDGILSKRGEKKIVTDVNYYKRFSNPIGLRFTNYNTVSTIKRNLYSYGDMEYSFQLGDGNSDFPMWYSDNGYIYSFHALCDNYESLIFRYEFSENKGTIIDTPKLMNVSATMSNGTITFTYTVTETVLSKKYSAHNLYPTETIPNTYPNVFTQERYDVYKNADLTWREIQKQEFTDFCNNVSNYETKNVRHWIGVKPQYLILNEEMPTEEVEVFDFYYEKDNYNNFESIQKSNGYIEVPKSMHKVIDMGVNWEGYEHYQDLNKWSGTILYNDKVLLYNPDLIPKEKEGET